MVDEDKPIIVFSGSLIDADLLKVFLEENGITAFLQDQVIGTVSPWGIQNNVKVVVSASDIEKAKPLIQQFLAEKKNNSEG